MLYKYKCTSCEYEFDFEKSIRDKTIPKCPLCKEPSQRVYKALPVIYKTSGYYTTDNK